MYKYRIDCENQEATFLKWIIEANNEKEAWQIFKDQATKKTFINTNPNCVFQNVVIQKIE